MPGAGSERRLSACRAGPRDRALNGALSGRPRPCARKSTRHGTSSSASSAARRARRGSRRRWRRLRRRVHEGERAPHLLEEMQIGVADQGLPCAAAHRIARRLKFTARVHRIDFDRIKQMSIPVEARAERRGNRIVRMRRNDQPVAGCLERRDVVERLHIGACRREVQSSTCRRSTLRSIPGIRTTPRSRAYAA